MNHPGRSIEKPFARAIARTGSSTIFYGMKDRAAQTKDELGRRENNMNQIKSIKLGLIAMCIATVSLSLAQTPRTGTSRSNQTAGTTHPARGQSGSSGNPTGATQTGTNARTGAKANAGAPLGANRG